MIMTEEVPLRVGLHLKLSGVCTLADTAATARNREGASSARRSAMKPPRELPAANMRRGSIPISVASLSTTRGQEPHIVDVGPVRAVVSDSAARVPITPARAHWDRRPQSDVRRRGGRTHIPSRFAFARRFHPSRASPPRGVRLSGARAARRSCRSARVRRPRWLPLVSVPDSCGTSGAGVVDEVAEKRTTHANNDQQAQKAET